MPKSLNDLPPALTHTDIPDFQVQRGKVGDTYDLGDGTRLMVRTDRISTFDSVHPNGVPNKGKILTAMTAFWLQELKKLVPGLQDHLLATDVADFGHGLDRYKDQLEGRSMLVKNLDIVPIECIVRGYITGSGWKDYKKDGAICGIELPSGMQESQKFESPLFTPSTKAVVGHDENISIEVASEQVGRVVMERLKDLSLQVYIAASRWAEKCGIILADTKFEWGKDGDNIVLADEVLTPDSSRFWPADQYVVGKSQPSFDKQYVRDHGESIGWNKKPPAPQLPDEVILKTYEKYVEAHNRLTGREFMS